MTTLITTIENLKNKIAFQIEIIKKENHYHYVDYEHLDEKAQERLKKTWDAIREIEFLYDEFEELITKIRMECEL